MTILKRWRALLVLAFVLSSVAHAAPTSADPAKQIRNAWAIWDPFYALAERFPGVHKLTDAHGIAPSNSFFLASRTFARDNPGLVRSLIAEIATVTKWKATHQGELAKVLADASGVDLSVEKIVAARGTYEVGYLTPQIIKEQQRIADTFAKLGLLPHTIVVQANVWSPHASVADAGTH